MKTTQMILTVSMSKRLIAKGLMAEPAIRDAMMHRRLLIVAGTTNAYVAGEALKAIGDDTPFDGRTFRRGITIAPGTKIQPGQADFDLLIDHGKAYFDRDVFAIAPELDAGDVILKGANALHLPSGETGVLIGHPQGGTMMPILSATMGRRVTLIAPVGLEKRVDAPISQLSALAGDAEAAGPRLCPLPGRAYTELDAVKTLTGAEDVHLLAAGGAMGAEGCVYLAVRGDDGVMERVQTLAHELKKEPATQL